MCARKQAEFIFTFLTGDSTSDDTTSDDTSDDSAGFSTVVIGVGTPLAFIILIALVITVTTAVFKLKRSKTTLQRKLTERGYVNEVVLEVCCHFQSRFVTVFNADWLNMNSEKDNLI